MDTPSIIRGYDHLDQVTQSLYAVSEPAPESAQLFTGPDLKFVDKPAETNGSGIVLNYDLPENGSIIIRTGISYISAEQARKNENEEIASHSFDQIKNAARQAWNDALGKIRVTGGTPDQQHYFYSALYRTYERMVNITEDGYYYSAFDNEVHKTDGHDFYTDDWSWDTFRSLHPLRTILNPQQEADMINSYILDYQASGWMPAFPTVSGDMGAMIGHHQADIITDAWMKGIRNYDINAAYEGLYKNAMEGTMVPWREGPLTGLDKVYLEKGFFPAKKPGQPETAPEVHPFEGRQAVAVTLEHSYDDWCLSKLAGALGKANDQKLLAARGQNYRNVYNPENGFMSPRTADGKWIEPFDPKSPAGVGGREYFAECNAWTYTWFVPQDIGGLAKLMGGKQDAINRLDRLFDEPPGKSKWMYLGNMPDATGLTGLFTMGNEPAFHIPYLYDLLGAPWKTQKRVRQLMEAWFRNDLMGVCGDDDGGAMSAWYVFSALGFYPVCPGNPVYVLGSPLFDTAVINLPEGKTFTVKAMNVSAQNKYIQSATINGKILKEPWFTHGDLVQGGELELQMGPRPNKNWGNNTSISDFYKLK
jgi:predicted alpha-1,2-mannosidase